MSDTDQTLDSEGSQDGTPGDRLVLVCLGSPERSFNQAGLTIPLRGRFQVRFGRAAGETWEQHVSGGVLQVSIPLPWVSSTHAELRLEGARPRIVDQGSRNGTFIESQPVRPHAPLGPGQVFEIGRSFWMLRLIRPSLDDADAPAPSPPLANPQMCQLQRSIARLAPSNVPILITGETGTGKEQLAHEIHVRSHRRGPLIRVSLATGSIDRLLRNGGERIIAARGGTLHLDDVGELLPEEQTKLTSTLMSHAPTGWSLAPTTQDELRIIASTARDLRSMVETNTFRPDLMARLAGFEARLPPLRARREDLGLLSRQILARQAGRETPPSITTDVFRAMLTHPWPFNLRELEHSLQTAARLVDGSPGTIDTDVWAQACWTVEGGDPSPTRIEAVRRELVAQLARHRGEIRAVAAALRCDVEDVQRWAQRFSLQPDRYRDVG